MAKQMGPVFLTGTAGGLTYYKMNGQYYARAKSSLSSRRVKKSQGFQRTMEHARRLAAASRIGSVIYRQLPCESRQHAQYRAITGQAIQLLKSGMDAAATQAQLEKEHLQSPGPGMQP